MSTRGCIIELKKDVCKVGYLHYGANFASKLIHYGMLGLTFTEDVLKTDIEMEQKEGVVGVFYQETNDAGILDRHIISRKLVHLGTQRDVFFGKRDRKSVV